MPETTVDLGTHCLGLVLAPHPGRAEGLHGPNHGPLSTESASKFNTQWPVARPGSHVPVPSRKLGLWPTWCQARAVGVRSQKAVWAGRSSPLWSTGLPCGHYQPCWEKDQVPVCWVLSGSLALLRVVPCCFFPPCTLNLPLLPCRPQTVLGDPQALEMASPAHRKVHRPHTTPHPLCASVPASACVPEADSSCWGSPEASGVPVRNVGAASESTTGPWGQLPTKAGMECTAKHGPSSQHAVPLKPP